MTSKPIIRFALFVTGAVCGMLLQLLLIHKNESKETEDEFDDIQAFDPQFAIVDNLQDTHVAVVSPTDSVTSSFAWQSSNRRHRRSSSFPMLGRTTYSLAEETRELQSLVISMAEDRARMEGFIHRGITCNQCGASPVRGFRFKCANCADCDICEDCETIGGHDITHVFLKIRIPLPPLTNPRSVLLQPFYPGNSSVDEENILAELELLKSHCDCKYILFCFVEHCLIFLN